MTRLFRVACVLAVLALHALGAHLDAADTPSAGVGVHGVSVGHGR